MQKILSLTCAFAAPLYLFGCGDGDKKDDESFDNQNTGGHRVRVNNNNVQQINVRNINNNASRNDFTWIDQNGNFDSHGPKQRQVNTKQFGNFNKL